MANPSLETQSGLRLGTGIEVGFHNALSGTRLARSFPVLAGNVCRTQAAHALIGLEPLTFIDRVYTSLIKCSAKVNRSIATLGLFIPGRDFNLLPRHPVSKVALWKGGS